MDLPNTMNSEYEYCLKIDQLTGELSALATEACAMLKQCEKKLLAFKELRQLERGGSVRLLAAELNAKFTATAAQYRQALEKARVVRNLVDSLLDQARRGDADALLSVCLDTHSSLNAFENMLAQSEQQIQGSVETVNQAVFECSVALSSAGAFDRFMSRVMGGQPNRTG